MTTTAEAHGTPPTRPADRTTDVWRCPECGHNDLEHDTYKGNANPCSFGWCACSLVRKQVRDAGQVEAIPVWEAYNATTGRWAR